MLRNKKQIFILGISNSSIVIFRFNASEFTTISLIKPDTIISIKSWQMSLEISHISFLLSEYDYNGK